ncbi:MAG: hypothetical protein ACE5ID_03205, partial [Acidobacteriota bacterium]
MKPRARLVGLVAMAASLAFLAIRTACYLPFARSPVATPGNLRPAGATAPAAAAEEPLLIRGVLHVHLPTRLAAFQATLRAASRASLDFILFSSPQTLDPSTDGREGYYTLAGLQPRHDSSGEGAASHPLLVLMGVEVETDRGPLLIAGGTTSSYPLTHRSTSLIQAAHAAGALVLALRPCHLPQREGSVSSPATPDPPAGVDGVEAVSLAADFTSFRYPRLLGAGLIALLNRPAALASLAQQPADGRPPAATLSWPGPARPVGGFGLTPGEGTWPDRAEPDWTLDWVTTTVRLDYPLSRQPAQFAQDREALLEALIQGQTGVVVNAWGKEPPPRLTYEPGESRVHAVFKGDPPVWMVLRQDGRVAAEGPGPVLAAAPAGSGAWRVETYLRRRDAGLPGAGWLLWQVPGPLLVASGEEPP